MTIVTTKRVYDPVDPDEGVRVLVDRLWPRGVSKQSLKADHWLREVAPSNQLRQWFGHDPKRWEEFKLRYAAELQAKPEAMQFLLGLARERRLVLLYSARDLQFNQAIALQQHLASLMQNDKDAGLADG
jgi:uncharacterized protein YeaO (DUF488 family)